MEKSCRWCHSTFVVSDEDLAFYTKISPTYGGRTNTIPPPTLCPSCRMQRRIAFRNERKLYSRACDLCKKSIVSLYSPDKPFTVYCPECWWSDKWDPTAFGQDLDFSKPFFEQFAQLQRRAPLLSNIVTNSVNCEYNSYCVDSKDCYMSQRVVGENVYYSYLPLNCVWCVDCFNIFDSQYCYECVDCWNCYGCHWGQRLRNCNDCMLCQDCIGCKNCVGCVGLRNAEYHVFNKKCTPEEYQQFLTDHPTDDIRVVRELQRTFREEVALKHPVRALIIDQSENATGNYLSRSKNIRSCYDVEETDTASNAWGVEYARDAVDSAFIYHGENTYENVSNSHSVNIYHSFAAFNAHDLRYCMLCFAGTHDCFGCIALRQKKYCILNKQYSNEEYEKLVPKIIELMAQDKTWGEYFEPQLSLFGYNESVAQEFFPLTQKEATARGFPWSVFEQPKVQVSKSIPAAKLPESLDQIPDDVLNWAIEDEGTGKPFKILKQELDFYRTHHIPLPRKHPDERHAARFALRNPRKLWDRQCMKCQKPMETTYAPDRQEIVYCEDCYRETVY